jgi:hypothetical protein
MKVHPEIGRANLKSYTFFNIKFIYFHIIVKHVLFHNIFLFCVLNKI